jgi:hypothetical protein
MIGLYLAAALAADDQTLKEGLLAKLKGIIPRNSIDFLDTQSLLGEIYRKAKDAELQGIVKHAADDLDRQQVKSGDR